MQPLCCVSNEQDYSTILRPETRPVCCSVGIQQCIVVNKSEDEQTRTVRHAEVRDEQIDLYSYLAEKALPWERNTSHHLPSLQLENNKQSTINSKTANSDISVAEYVVSSRTEFTVGYSYVR